MADTQPTHIENWRPIPGYEGSYEASDHGRVRSLDRIVLRKDGRKRRAPGRVLKPAEKHGGYLRVELASAEGKRTRTVHSLVMSAFAGPRPDGMDVCHNDGNPANNHLSNLRYGTRSENVQDITRHGRNVNANKSHCNRGHLLADPNLVQSMLRKGSRTCLACNRARGRVRKNPAMKSQMQQVADTCYAEVLRKG